MLDRQETSGPPEAGLYFVGDEQGSVLAAQVERTLKIAVVRSDDALALNRLDDEGCHLSGVERFFEREKIVEWDANAVRQQRPEPGAERVVAVERQCSIRQAVEGVVTKDDPGAAGRRPRKLERGLY